jgi:hypothetical protein
MLVALRTGFKQRVEILGLHLHKIVVSFCGCRCISRKRTNARRLGAHAPAPAIPALRFDLPPRRCAPPDSTDVCGARCSVRFPGQTTRQRCRSPRAISSLIRSPATTAAAVRHRRVNGEDRIEQMGEVGELDSFRTEPLHADDGYEAARQNSANGRIELQILQTGRGTLPCLGMFQRG